MDDVGLLKAAQEVARAADVSPSTKADARFLIAKAHVQTQARASGPMDATVRAVIEGELAQLRKDYPDDERTDALRLELAVALEPRDSKAAESMLRELAGSQNIRIASVAQQRLIALASTRQLAKAPLQLKFKAIDGTEVDLAKLRGKVVLVDFWATWCGPCRMEMPNVVAAYNQLHTNGFEIVGVSLDQSKDRLLAYAQQAGMTWPEYFDGKGWGNEISSGFGINSIPAAWLVDKKGVVRTTQARGANLAEQVKMLLAE